MPSGSFVNAVTLFSLKSAETLGCIATSRALGLGSRIAMMAMISATTTNLHFCPDISGRTRPSKGGRDFFWFFI
ncbi:MAG: hypothetical protein HZC02_01690 [Candidatus Levybacteria bacterium]|nr:hypothetical protein [Candidatus Levybacteria bacterium]